MQNNKVGVDPVYPYVPDATALNYQPTQPQPQQPTIIVQQPVVYNMRALGSHPTQIQCQYCHATVVTRVVHKSGLGTWLICGGICLLGFWLGCQFIPFCIDSCKDSVHYCPNCNKFLGERKMM